jgi:TetR/AcrR family transcriptional repressor of nem operon
LCKIDIIFIEGKELLAMGYSAAHIAQKREDILTESIRLFRERGFSGVSVSEVMKAAGLTHGPFYNHFASKDDLKAQSLAHELQRAIDALDKIPASERGKDSYVRHYLSVTHRDDIGTGCAIAALASEVHREEVVRGPFTDLLKATLQKLASHFPWKSKRSARSHAIHMVSAMVGGLILARAVNDDQFSNEILSEVRKHID